MRILPRKITARRRLVAVVLLFVAMVTLVLVGLILFGPARQDEGFSDDFNDVKLEQVIAFAERANSAYHEAATFRKEYGPQVDAGEFPGSGLRVYLDHNPAGTAQWVILRGTANMQNVLDDLEFVGCDEHELGINVHAGFDASLQECLPWILQHLDQSRPIWVTGHSLGGAVAALLVATLDHRGFKDVFGITFGQPKFTDADGAAKLAHLKILRIVHDEDPIPLLPPVSLEGESLALYHHCGPEVVVKASGQFLFLKEHNAKRMNVAEIWQDLEHLRPMFHDMVKGYLPALKGALASAPHHAIRQAESPSPKP
ncbi:MAG: lipase family protein [Verrucomicrobia bacterium]|nr:lipase family protein [Verrucomicrobiota bacterium]